MIVVYNKVYANGRRTLKMITLLGIIPIYINISKIK